MSDWYRAVEVVPMFKLNPAEKQWAVQNRRGTTVCWVFASDGFTAEENANAIARAMNYCKKNLNNIHRVETPDATL